MIVEAAVTAARPERPPEVEPPRLTAASRKDEKPAPRRSLVFERGVTLREFEQRRASAQD
jgi:hypothetical protein